MAGERLVRATFTRAGRCRLCGAHVEPRRRLEHAGRHLFRARVAGMVGREDEVHRMRQAEP